MKKLIALLTAIIMIAAVFTACSGSDDSQGASAEKGGITDASDSAVNLKTVLDSVNKVYPDDTGDATELTTADDLKKYYNIDAEDVKQFAAEIDKKNSSLEIVLVEASSADSAAKVKSALEVRYNQLRSNGASYDAEQLEMVNKCEVTTNGNYVIYIISSKYNEMLEVVNAELG